MSLLNIVWAFLKFANQFFYCLFVWHLGYGSTVNQTIIIRNGGLGSNPCVMECLNCHTMVTTQPTYVSGGLTWLTAGLICLFGYVHNSSLSMAVRSFASLTVKHQFIMFHVLVWHMQEQGHVSQHSNGRFIFVQYFTCQVTW